MIRDLSDLRDEDEIFDIRKKNRRSGSGKPLFPWKTRYGPDLKRGLIKLIYFYGIYKKKGSDKLPHIRKKTDKWNFIAAEFWKQNCCEVLRMSGEFNDIKAPTGLSVEYEFYHILTEVQTAMHWDNDTLANLSQMEGDSLPEYESLVKEILLDQLKQKSLDDLKQSQDNEKEKNEVTVLINGLSEESSIALKTSSKSIRKRDRENTSSDEPVSSLSSSGYGNKHMHYFGMMMNKIKEQEIKKESVASTTTASNVLSFEESYELQRNMYDCLHNIEWWECLIGGNEDENCDIARAQRIGVRIIIAAFCRKPNDFNSFTDEMVKLQLSYLAANKLFYYLCDTYVTMKCMHASFNMTAMTPSK